MSYVVLLLVSVGVTIYALVDCWRSTDDEVRGLPRPAWILLIILVGPLGVPPFGAAAYLVFGRPTALPRPRVVAPDDDPDFLRQLDRRRHEQRHRSDPKDPGRKDTGRKGPGHKDPGRKDSGRVDRDGAGPEPGGHSPP